MITAAEVDELVDALVEQTRAYVAKSLDPLVARLHALEEKQIIAAAAPPVRDADPAVVAALKTENRELRARIELLEKHAYVSDGGAWRDVLPTNLS